MTKRGDELREHILWAAKDVFLELGFERASMDTVAARAATSKRTLYAHFESKDKLFLAVVELVRELYLDGLKTPGHYGDDGAEAVVLFCGRFLQMLLYRPALRACRLVIAEADRHPEASARYYSAIFDTPHLRLAAFLRDRYQLTTPASTDRALLGLDELLAEPPDEASIAADLDLAPIRRAVAALQPSEPAATGPIPAASQPARRV